MTNAPDEVRRSEYQRLVGKERGYTNGARYVLLSDRENLSLNGRLALKKPPAADEGLNAASLLKVSFDQFWDHRI